MRVNKKPIITIHGIRRQEEWDITFKNLDIWNKKNAIVLPFIYGYLTIWGFLNPFKRRKIIKKFQQFYSEQNFEHNNWPHIVCHSFGSYIFFRSIKTYTSLKFDKVILCGSIIDPKIDWQFFFENDQVQSVYNDYGICDRVVKHSSKVLKFAGNSGEIGFTNISGSIKTKFHNRKNYFEHSDYFLPQHMKENWVQALFPNNFAYKEEILRPEIFERIYSNINSKEPDIELIKTKYSARIDKNGNYYAHYYIEGLNSSDQALHFYPMSTTADSIQDIEDMDFKALDASKNLLDVKNITNDVQHKEFHIYFNKPIRKGETFRLLLRFMWKSTISLKCGDTDHFEIANFPNAKVALNFPYKLRAARFYLVANRCIIQQLEAEVKNRKDQTYSYVLEYNNSSKYDGIIFYFEGANMNSPIASNKPSSKKENGIIISKCTQQDIAQIYKIELEVEHSNAANEQTLNERLEMFNDGFLVAKENSKIIGYIECVVWNEFDFKRFDEIKNFPLHYDVNGETLYVIFIAVKEEYRHRGIASMLLDEAEKVAKKYNVTKMQLVAKDNLTELYGKNKFNVVKELKDFLPNTKYKSILMNKQIDS